MNVIVAANETVASRHAASLIGKQLNNKPNSVFLLPTGSTPLPLYGLLAEKVATKKISFAHAKSFNLDEYLGLSKHHPQSYHYFMRQNLFDKIDIKKTNTNIPNPRPSSSKRFCQKYESAINHNPIDLAILGIGQNGHIGFNEPGTDFKSLTHVAKLSDSTIAANSRFFSSEKEVPKAAITVGLSTILKAKKIILLASGKNKAQAVKDALEKKPNELIPASILQKHKNVTFILDREAASKLNQTELKPPVLSNIRLYSSFNLPKNKTIVFFSPHPDDASICAGALLTALSQHNTVHELIVTTGHHAVSSNKSTKQIIITRENETIKESAILGTKPAFLRCRFYDNGNELLEADMKKVRNILKKIKPDIAFVPHKLDTHPTHMLTRQLALASLPHNIVLWSFETPWALFSHKKFNSVFEFSEKLMKKKLKAIRQHKSQIQRTSFDDAAYSIAHFRRITIAEQLFSELGRQPFETQPYLELFNISRW